MSRRRNAFHRKLVAPFAIVGGFTANLLMLGMISIVQVPLFIHFGGLQTWSSIAVGQTVGAVLATLVGMGWGVNGPGLISEAPLTSRSIIASRALRTRILALVALAPVSAIACHILVDQAGLAFLSSLPLMLGGLSSTFYFIGISSPRRLLLQETAIRVGGGLLSVLATIWSRDVLWGVATQVGTMLIAVLVANCSIVGSIREIFHGKPTREIWSQLPHVGYSALTSLTAGAPILVVAHFAPVAVGAYSVFDRVMRQATVVLSPVAAYLQAWTPRAINFSLRKVRARAVARWSIPALTAIGIVVGIAANYALVGFSAGQVVPTATQGILFGIALCATAAQQCVAYGSLLPLGLGGSNSSIAVVTLILTVALVALMGSTAGVTGALAGVAIAQAAGVVVQVSQVLRRTQINRNNEVGS